MINFKINIADIIISFRSADTRLRYNPQGAKYSLDFKGFVYKGKRYPDVKFKISYHQTPSFSWRKLIFKANGWRYYRYRESFLYDYPGSSSNGKALQITEVNCDLSEGTIYAKPTRTQLPRGEFVMSRIRTDLLQALLIEYLVSKTKGLLLHSTFLKDADKGYLFLGARGAGKTTLAQIWAKHKGVRIFNDDRTVVIPEGKDVYFRNVLWRGDFHKGYPLPNYRDISQINKIFFIYHNKRNRLDNVSKPEAVHKMLKQTFLPFWRKELLSDAVVLCKKIADQVSCFDLGFVNNDSVVEFIRSR